MCVVYVKIQGVSVVFVVCSACESVGGVRGVCVCVYVCGVFVSVYR